MYVLFFSIFYIIATWEFVQPRLNVRTRQSIGSIVCVALVLIGTVRWDSPDQAIYENIFNNINQLNDYDTLSLEDLTVEAGKIIEDLENQKDLDRSIEKYQNLLRLNKIIEKKFQIGSKNISEKTRENILKIISKKNAKEIK